MWYLLVATCLMEPCIPPCIISHNYSKKSSPHCCIDADTIRRILQVLSFKGDAGDAESAGDAGNAGDAGGCRGRRGTQGDAGDAGGRRKRRIHAGDAEHQRMKCCYD